MFCSFDVDYISVSLLRDYWTQQTTLTICSYCNYDLQNHLHLEKIQIFM